MWGIGSTLDRFFGRAAIACMPQDWDRDDPGAYWPLRMIWAWRVLVDPNLLTSFIRRSRSVP